MSARVVLTISPAEFYPARYGSPVSLPVAPCHRRWLRMSHERKRLRGENKGKDEEQASDLSSVRSAPSKMLFGIGIDR